MSLLTMDPQKQRAHAVLDDVRDGVDHPADLVRWALLTLGEPVA